MLYRNHKKLNQNYKKAVAFKVTWTVERRMHVSRETSILFRGYFYTSNLWLLYLQPIFITLFATLPKAIKKKIDANLHPSFAALESSCH